MKSTDEHLTTQELEMIREALVSHANLIITLQDARGLPFAPWSATEKRAERARLLQKQIMACRLIGMFDVAHRNSISSDPMLKQHVYTEDEVLAILRNMGHDVECGSCMAIAFTGVGLPGDEHSCGIKKEAVIVSFGDTP